VYLAVLVMMLASSVGVPIPEEITIVSVGILAFMGANPQTFPPPFVGAPVVNGIHIAIYTTLIVLLADFGVYSMGKFFGNKALEMPTFKRVLTGSAMTSVNSFIKKYGLFATFIFRFTPGLRFPAHLMLGISGFSPWKFLAVDSLACLISIPTQILLLAHFGEPILSLIYKFKNILFAILFIALMAFIAVKLKERYATRSSG
jgi:membrane protein DedA with SNARE-associated domain